MGLRRMATSLSRKSDNASRQVHPIHSFTRVPGPFRKKSGANCDLNSQWYRHAHAKDMPLRAIARLIQTMLYAQRFFPYYVYNILGGIEEDG